jgi:hypothetical protein
MVLSWPDIEIPAGTYTTHTHARTRSAVTKAVATRRPTSNIYVKVMALVSVNQQDDLSTKQQTTNTRPKTVGWRVLVYVSRGR